jgi:hypothetical protein
MVFTCHPAKSLTQPICGSSADFGRASFIEPAPINSKAATADTIQTAIVILVPFGN